jgi:hypothetical protein
MILVNWESHFSLGVSSLISEMNCTKRSNRFIYKNTLCLLVNTYHTALNITLTLSCVTRIQCIKCQL